MVFADGAIQEIVVWQVPQPVPGSTHSYKYRMVYVVEGQRVLGHDNERGKGDHKHVAGLAEACCFRNWTALIEDFLADVATARRKRE